MVKDAIVGSLIDIGASLKNLMQPLLDFLANLKSDFIGWFGTIVDALNSLKDTIVGWFRDVVDSIIGIPTSFLELLKSLFIPKTSPFDKLGVLIESKFPFVKQVLSLLSSVVFSGTGSAPMFTVTYAGHTVSIVDFDTFLPYMGVIHAMIIAIAYYRFFRKLRTRIPAIIGGFYI